MATAPPNTRAPAIALSLRKWFLTNCSGHQTLRSASTNKPILNPISQASIQRGIGSPVAQSFASSVFFVT